MSILPDGTQDQQTVTTSGESVQPLPVGVTFAEIKTHSDERGTVFELFDPRKNWHPEPLVFSYIFTIRPGFIKGWGMHKKHEDRYAILYGELKVVLYDGRLDSPTHGLVSTVVLSEYQRRMMNVPVGVWHADQNIGNKDVVVVNFPTIPYDHADPDKYRLPLDTDLIPYKFDDPHGW